MALFLRAATKGWREGGVDGVYHGIYAGDRATPKVLEYGENGGRAAK